MLDFQSSTNRNVTTGKAALSVRRSFAKTTFDLVVAVLLIVPLGVVAGCLLLLNPLLNKGPLLFRQQRMGQNCMPFTAYKFRSMSAGKAQHRGAFDALEHARITGFGRLMRKTRVDELPQVINVLRGEMSLIGPRPDSFEHAQVYLHQIPNYAMRHRVIPGISGFAQIKVGYVDGHDGILAKVDADIYYLRHASFRFDMWIAWRTVCVVLGAKGL